MSTHDEVHYMNNAAAKLQRSALHATNEFQPCSFLYTLVLLIGFEFLIMQTKLKKRTFCTVFVVLREGL